MIVSDVAGTTRDAIDTELEVDGRRLRLVDTAGIRRQAKVQESVEYYTALRSQRAAERADVALVVCDANDGVTSQDLRIAELAMKSGCATALVLNKWDLDERRRVRPRPRARARRPEAAPAPARADRDARRPAATSHRLLREALVARRPRRAPASRRPSSTASSARSSQPRQPPQKQGHRLKLLYIAQIGERPPRFAIQVNTAQASRATTPTSSRTGCASATRSRAIPLIIDFVERKQRRRAA